MNNPFQTEIGCQMWGHTTYRQTTVDKRQHRILGFNNKKSTNNGSKFRYSCVVISIENETH